MEKTELIFAIIIMIAYVICSVALKIPIIAHLMFGALLLGVIIIAVLLKYENEKISKIFRIISIILIICYVVSFIYEAFYYKPLFVDSPIFIFLILIVELISWILRKNND